MPGTKADKTASNPKRGEIWIVQLDPTRGAEIGKTRPAVVVSSPAAGRMPLRLIVPLTTWQTHFAGLWWLACLNPDSQNGLTRPSAADAFQTRSVSLERFVSRVGVLSKRDLNLVVEALALTVRYKPDVEALLNAARAAALRAGLQTEEIERLLQELRAELNRSGP